MISSARQDVISSGPAIAGAGASSARILSPSPAGPGLEIVGDPALGSFVEAIYGATSGSSDTTAAVTVTPAAGASFVYLLLGSGSRYTTQQLRIQRTPGSSVLEAAAATGTAPCGAIADGTPTDLAVVFHAASGTFDVRIGGAASGCTGLPTRLQPPVVGFGMMDASNEGWGGRVDFTGLTMF